MNMQKDMYKILPNLDVSKLADYCTDKDLDFAGLSEKVEQIKARRNESAKRYKILHRDKVRAACREYLRLYRSKNRERLNAFSP